MTIRGAEDRSRTVRVFGKMFTNRALRGPGAGWARACLAPGGLLLLLAFPLVSSCSPENESLIEQNPPTDDPCNDGRADLSDGIQDGSELRAVFDCVNRAGQFDAFVPLVDAMETSTISDGQTTVLDMWIDVVRQESEKASDVDLSAVQTDDLAEMLDKVIALLDEDWLPEAVDLMGQFLDSGAVEPGIVVLGSVAGGIVEQQWDTEDPEKYDNFLNSLVELLCPDLDTKEQCVGDVEQLMIGMAEVSALPVDDQGDSGTDAGEELTKKLSGLFAPEGKNESANEDLNRSLGRGIERLGDSSFLVDTFATILPAIYGDDPETPDVFEGYETFNANESGLYGLLELMGDEEYALAMNDMMNETPPLVDSYYTWNALKSGDSQAALSGSCSAQNTGEFEDDNPAYYGLDQILRLLKASDVDWKTQEDCKLEFDLGGTHYKFTMDELKTAMEFAGLELSDSTNLATFMLEAFAQLPVDIVQTAVDLGSLDDGVLGDFNQLCGTNIIPDDYEALQASVHIDEVIAPTLKLLAAIGHAGSMDATKDLIVGLYDTHMLCEAQPWLQAVIVPGGPLVSNPDDVQASPLAPGGDYHELVTIPMVRTLMHFQGDTASTIFQPIADGLEGTGKPIGSMLTGIGMMANAAESEAFYGGTPAMYSIDDIMADLSSYGSGDPSAEGLARSIQEEVLLTAMLETLAVPEVQDAFDVSYTDDGQTLIEFTAAFVNDGKLLELLNVLKGLLLEVDSQVGDLSEESSE